MLSCKECELQFEFARSLKKHVRVQHEMLYIDYVIKHDHGGTRPTCACGCGGNVSFRNDSFFMSLMKGHVTQQTRDIQSSQRLGKKMSDETKAKISEMNVSFWNSDAGKIVAEQRTQKLKKFHQSQAGKIWSVEQSQRLKQFNATDRGKQIRKDAAAKVTKWYEENPDSVREIGDKIKEHFKTPAGKESLRIRSEKLRSFYSSPPDVKLFVR